MAEVRVGLSGYSYPEWKGEGKLYPPKLSTKDFLRFYSGRYETVETVGTFMHMPTEKTVGKWVEETAEGFKVCVKMHRQVTHFGRLKPETLETVEEICKTLEPLVAAEKCGPILLQLPPNLKRNDHLLDTFLGGLPTGFEWAIEFRHESWSDPVVEALLRAYGVAWVAADTDEEDAPRRDTAAFHYVRLRKSEYDEAALDEWATYLLGTGKPGYVFCRHKEIPAPWVWADRLVSRVQGPKA